MYAPITYLVIALNLLQQSLNRGDDRPVPTAPWDDLSWNITREDNDTETSTIPIQRYEIRGLRPDLLAKVVSIIQNAADDALGARIQEFGATFALDELMATRDANLLTPYWDYRIENGVPNESMIFYADTFRALMICQGEAVGRSVRDYFADGTQENDAFALLDDRFGASRIKALEVLRSTNIEGTLWQLLLAVTVENGKDQEAMSKEYCDSMSKWVVWDRSVATCRPRSLPAERTDDAPTPNIDLLSGLCMNASCVNGTCVHAGKIHDNLHPTSREAGEVLWPIEPLSTKSYTRFDERARGITSDDLTTSRIGSTIALTNSYTTTTIASHSGHPQRRRGKKLDRGRSRWKKKMQKKGTHSGFDSKKKKPPLDIQEMRTPLPEPRHWLLKTSPVPNTPSTSSVAVNEYIWSQDKKERGKKKNKKNKKKEELKKNRKSMSKGKPNRPGQGNDLDALLIYLPTPKSPPNTLLWKSKAPFPVVYFTITVVEGPLRDHQASTNRRARNARIHLMGLNMPTGYTQTTEGRQMRRGTGAIVRALSPELTGPFVELKIRVENKYGNPCKQLCLDSRQRYRRCARRTIRLSTYKNFSDPIPYFKTVTEARNAQWSGRGYYKRRKLDYVLFRCE